MEELTRLINALTALETEGVATVTGGEENLDGGDSIVVLTLSAGPDGPPTQHDRDIIAAAYTLTAGGHRHQINDMAVIASLIGREANDETYSRILQALDRLMHVVVSEAIFAPGAEAPFASGGSSIIDGVSVLRDADDGQVGGGVVIRWSPLWLPVQDNGESVSTTGGE